MCMERINTNITIDTALKKKAQELGIELSALMDNAIREKLNVKEVDASIDKCEFCGKKEEKATAKDPIGLIWLCPDEKWICDSCLKRKIRSIPVSKA